MSETHEPSLNDGSRQPWLIVLLVLAFLAAYLVCATIFQVRSGRPPSSERAPIEFFSRSLLWMLSLSSLLIANKGASSRWKLLFWLGACVALAALAIDERFEFHELTGRPPSRGGLDWFDDDYFKAFSWPVTAVVLFLIFRLERPTRWAKGGILVGYLFHGLWVLAELGDGDLFKLPLVSRDTVRWGEEFFELGFLASYLFGFLLILTDRRNV